LSLRRLAKIQLKLGLFEDKSSQAYFDPARYGINQIDTTAHQQLAYEAALQSIVLLKNDDNVLPLKPGIKLALIGPHVNAQEVFMSNYHGDRCAGGGFACIPSPLQTLTAANKGGSTAGVEGVEVNSAKNNISDAVAAGTAADAIVLLVGIDGSQEGEEHDRYNCTFPGLQPELIDAISALKKPTVMVLIHGGVMCLGKFKEAVPAIVDAFYGGEKGGEALASVLFGDYNPSGKLPVTMYPPEYMFENPLTQMSVTAPPGRTHLYYTGKAEYAFGSGLSYSKWDVEHLAQTAGAEAVTLSASGGSTSFKVRITNQGPMAGSQRVLAMVRPVNVENQPKTAPRQRLWAYQGKHLGVGESATLTFTAEAHAIAALSNEAGERVVLPGEYIVAFTDGVNEVQSRLRVTGSATVVEKSAFRHDSVVEAA